jgi:AcrR family transcriptional regulator
MPPKTPSSDVTAMACTNESFATWASAASPVWAAIRSASPIESRAWATTSVGIAGATSLYWHVANKEELLELAVDEVLGEIYVPEAGDAPWRVSVSTFANGVRATLLRHPWVIALLGTKPTLGPNALRMGDRVIALLTDAGFTGWAMSHVSALIHGHAIGSATTQAAGTSALRQSGIPVNEYFKNLEPYLDRITTDHPHYDQWRRANPMDDAEPMKIWEDSFAFGLERILDGLEHWLVTAKQA